VKRTLTYQGLQVETQVLAAIMRNFGVGKGDRVVLYMPMVPEAVIAMLACARIGAVHSVVFGGFAPKELATRIDDAKPKMILSARRVGMRALDARGVGRVRFPQYPITKSGRAVLAAPRQIYDSGRDDVPCPIVRDGHVEDRAHVIEGRGHCLNVVGLECDAA
jgi:acyl-CoA synthetase (AMP-forming)/AMP-acid ligase II